MLLNHIAVQAQAAFVTVHIFDGNNQLESVHVQGSHCFTETSLEKKLKLQSVKKESLTSIGNVLFNLNNFSDFLSTAKRASRFLCIIDPSVVQNLIFRRLMRLLRIRLS